MSFSKCLFIFIISTSLSCSKKPSPINSSVEKINNLKSVQNICWAGFLVTIKNYFNLNMSLKEINKFWKCIDNSINLLTLSLKGKTKNKYSYLDIQSILYKALKKESSTKKILSIFSLLKDLSFFQEGDFITKQDIDFFKSTIHQLKTISIKLYPYRKILFFSDTHSVSYAEYIEATEVLQQSFKAIEQIFIANKASYSFSSLNNFLKLFSKKHKEVTQFIFLIKSFLFIENTKKITEYEWRGLISPLASFYSVYRGFQLFYLNNKAPSFDNLSAQFKYYKFVENLFSKSLIKQKGFKDRAQGYLVEDIKRLLLKYQKIMPSKSVITPEFLDSAWTSVHKLLSNTMYRKGNIKLNSKFFSIQHVLSLKGLLLRWFYVQNLNLQFLGISKQSLFATDRLFIKHKDKVIGGVNLLPIRHSFINRVNTKIGKQKMDNQGRLLFVDSYNLLFLWNNLTSLNKESLLIDVVFSLYAGKDQKVDFSELSLAFNDFKSIFIFTKILDPQNIKMPESIYRETNLFMPSSQPDAVIDKQEALEYLHYIFSGLNIKSSWAILTDKNCSSYKKGLDTFYETSCVYNQFLKNQQSYFQFLPQQIYQLGFLNNSKEWFNAVTIAAGHVDGKIFNKKNIFKTGMLLQYITTVFNRFDVNTDFQLSYFESLAFFPLVKEALQSFLPIGDPLELQNLYTYLLKNGEFPNSESDILSEFRLLSWSLNPNKAYKASFFQVLRVFKALRAFAL